MEITTLNLNNVHGLHSEDDLFDDDTSSISSTNSPCRFNFYQNLRYVTPEGTGIRIYKSEILKITPEVVNLSSETYLFRIHIANT